MIGDGFLVLQTGSTLGSAMFDSKAEARAEIFESIEAFDNRVRRHSSLGYVAPAEFARAHHQTHR